MGSGSGREGYSCPGSGTPDSLAGPGTGQVTRLWDTPPSGKDLRSDSRSQVE